MTSPTIGMGILSWGGAGSLKNSIASYKTENLFSLLDESVLVLPEPDEVILDVSKSFPGDVKTFPKNLGIGPGMKAVAEALSTDYVLLMENDCPLIESHEEAARQLHKATELIDSGQAIMARFRSIREPGEPFHVKSKYSRYYGDGVLPVLRRLIRPGKAKRLVGSSVFFEDNPAKAFPRYIKHAGDNFYLISAKNMPWSNQSILLKRNVFLNTIMPYVESSPSRRRVNGFRNIEIELNRSKFWLNSGWSTACGPGLFTHSREEYRGY